MGQLLNNNEVTAVVGMGATGLSVARHLARLQLPFVVLDTRKEPPLLAEFRREFPRCDYELGPLNPETLLGVARIVVSPGFSLADPAITAARSKGIPIVGDIQLFADAASAPVIAITGSNGKSTVTTVLGDMLKRAGKAAAVGGNLGTPALDLLQEEADCYVVEVSSFQLESTPRLNPKVATVLNVSPDHLDRHETLESYRAAKHAVYRGAAHIVVNRDDPLSFPDNPHASQISFGMDRPAAGQFGLISEDGVEWLAVGHEEGVEKLLPASELRLAGRHNLANALAALALGQHLNLPMDAMRASLREFSGLPHRCQWVASKNGVDFFNDSKGTNIGASLAALQGLSRLPAKIVLIAGGDGKGADFNQLADAIHRNVRAVVSIGVDGPAIAEVARQSGVVAVEADSMAEAVKLAFRHARPGDAVVLSPACASLDMFKNYEDRGDQFVQAVAEVSA